nr:hypothetical protein [Plantibacter sp. Leaf314]
MADATRRAFPELGNVETEVGQLLYRSGAAKRGLRRWADRTSIQRRSDGTQDDVPVVHDHAIREPQHPIPLHDQLGVPPAVLFVSVAIVVELTTIPFEDEPSVDHLIDPADSRDGDLVTPDDASGLEADPSDALEDTVATRFHTW